MVCLVRKLVYLDNSATTKPCETAVERINNALRENWGNPSSLHGLGIKAEQEMNRARQAVADLLSCRTDEIFFTSGGTEANNIAIMGAVNARRRRGKRIVTTSIEHSSTLETIVTLEKQGFDVVYLKPDRSGVVAKEDIDKAITSDTILVSIMLVNNETGAIQPVKAAAEAISRISAPAMLHCDAVQAFGKMNLNPSRMGIDLMTFSAHKFHGPKGIGGLYKSKNVKIAPLTYGGGQERGLRSGTEATPLIAGMLGAIEELPDCDKQLEIVRKLRDYAIERLKEIEGISFNSPPDALPYIINISVDGKKSETMMHFLESRNIYVSSGSACAKGKGSHVLRSMGLSDARVDSALRISFSKNNDYEDVDIFIDALKEGIKTLRSFK